MLKPPDDLIPLARIVAQIRIYCNEQSSGIVFLASEDNRMAQVHLKAGQIVAVICRNKRGIAAIQLMCDIRSAHIRFDGGQNTTSNSDELLTEAFFDYLSATPNKTQAAASKVPVPSGPLTSDVKLTLQKLLAKFIGPMAEIICQDHFDGASNTLRVIEALANEIPKPEDAAKFRSDAARAIEG
ncbi:hypothetical protein [Propionivibrio sp.]|uniref:hypothetical protein n=1 Tax=Propionivibrio sp. TaxID=2212460 RepID=UPI002616D371|nr:hypothetical protein [Propionivibrio sp.]